MHLEYMRALLDLRRFLDIHEQVEHRFSHLPTYRVRHRARELIQFDRDILLAQRKADMAASNLTNNHGDLNPMSAKNFPEYIRLDGQVYIHGPGTAACCVPVVRERDVPKGSPFDVKPIDASAVLEYLEAKLSETALASEIRELSAHSVAFSTVGTAEIQHASTLSAPRMSIDAMASEAYHQQGYPVSNSGAESRWTAAYAVARLRLTLGGPQ